jgi:hypothetical protein
MLFRFSLVAAARGDAGLRVLPPVLPKIDAVARNIRLLEP